MTYNRQDLAVQVNIKSLKGYTMRDIGALEDRIKRLEYYTVLNALSLDTKTLSIRDENNQFERFKNGIFADPFNDHTLGRTEDREYAINVSSLRSVALSRYEPFQTDFKYQSNASTNVKIAGRLAMIDYDAEYLGGNPYASIYRNCTEAYYNWKGYLQLFPNYDSGKVVTASAPQNINIDIAGAFKSLLATGIAQKIDTEVGRPVLTNSESTTSGLTTTTTNYYSQTTTTTVKDLGVEVNKITQSTGPLVQDVSVLPYMRSRIIGIWATGMKPNTTVHCYFDNQPVDEFCVQAKVNPDFADINNRPDPAKLKNLVGGQENIFLVPNGPLNGPFKTDDEGTIYLNFLLPENKFRTGDRTFIITNVDDLKAQGAVYTKAEGTYTASALSVKTTDISFNILQPVFVPTTTTTSTTKTWSDTTTVTRNPPSDPGGGGGDGGSEDSTGSDFGGSDGGGDPGGDDPVAETFMIQDASQVRVPGVYMAAIGVYFKKKSPTLGITLNLCETTSGVIDSSKIIARVHHTTDQCSVSEDSSAETIFTFNQPALLATDKTYAFYMVPDGTNPDYEIWISEVGGTDKITGAAINQQPFSGIMYVSSNGKSWTPVQSQDIKFRMYRAKFKYNTATAVFSNETYDYLTLQNTSRYNTGVGIQVGQVVYSANSADLTQILTDTTINPFGIVSYVDELNNILYLERSNGKFSNNATFKNIRIFSVEDYSNTSQIIPANLIANSTIYKIDDLPYHQLAPKFVTAEPIGSSLVSKFYGTSNSTSSAGPFIKDTTPINVVTEQLTELRDYERVIRSYSNEVAQGGFGVRGNSTYEIVLRTNNDYVSPVIDLGTKSIKFIRNLISSNNVNEHTRYGYALNRYVSQVVALATPSEDFRVYLTGYRPEGSNIEVYVKIKNSNDSDNFDDKAWTKMTPIKNDSGANTGLLFSNSLDDYKEFIYGLPRWGTPVANVNISGTTMTVNSLYGGNGAFAVGETIVGTGVLPGTVITALGTGTGGTGTYTITPSHGAIGPIDIKATPNYTSANVAYADYNADGYSNDKFKRGIATYYDSSYSLQTTFNQFAIKILLLANDPVKVPNMRDVRAIAMMLA